MPREGKFEACIPGNHRKREFPLTPEPVWLTDNSSSRADWTVWEYSLCKRYFMFLCISIPFYLFCIFIPTSRHPVWNYWRNLPHHSALSVFCLFTICFKNFSKVFLFNFQIKNICKVYHFSSVQGGRCCATNWYDCIDCMSMVFI